MTTIARVVRYGRGSLPPSWDIGVYWRYDPEKHPHDYDLFVNPREWRKLSGLRNPKKNEVMKVKISFDIVE